MSEQRGVFKFFTAEEIDKMIITRLNMHRKRGGTRTNIWNEETLLVRRQVILDYMAQGLGHTRIAQELMNRWGIGDNVARSYIKDAIEYLEESSLDFAEHTTSIMTKRLEAIAEDALAHGDRKSALAAYDQLNKMNGHYLANVNLKTDTTISFDFGNTEG